MKTLPVKVEFRELGELALGPHLPIIEWKHKSMMWTQITYRPGENNVILLREGAGRDAWTSPRKKVQLLIAQIVTKTMETFM